MAKDNPTFEKMAQKLYTSNADDEIRRICQQREEYEFHERVTQAELESRASKIAEQHKTIAKQAEIIDAQSTAIIEKDSIITQRDATISQKDAEIAALKARLGEQ